ncbi:SNF2-related protein, partial [Candidatus Magnetomorum sp. HK-1]
MVRIESKQNKQNYDLLKTLRSHYEKLSYSEQSIVLLISMVHLPISRSVLLRCLTKLDVKTPKGTRYQTHTIEPVLKKLMDLDLIENANYPGASKTFSDYALLLATESNRLEDVANAIESMEKGGNILTNKSTHKTAITLRNIRLAYFRKKYDTFEELFFEANQPFNQNSSISHYLTPFIKNISQKPFKGELPYRIKLFCINESLLNALITLEPCETDFETLRTLCNKSKSSDLEDNTILALQYLYRARFDEAKALLSNTNNHSQLLLHGWLAYLTGNGDQAIEYFQMAFKSTDSQANEIVRVSIFFCLAELLRRDNNYSFEQSDNIIILARKINNPDWFSKILELFEIAIRCRLDPDYKPSFYSPIRSFDYYNFKNKDRPALVQLFSALGAKLSKNDNFDYSKIYNLFKKAISSGYLWFAGELAKILLHSNLKLTTNEKKELTNTISNAGHKGLKIFLFDAFNMQVNWQRVMDKLLEIKPYKPPSQSKPKKIKTSSSRLVWILSIKKGRCSLKPKEQKQSSNGKWSKVLFTKLFFDLSTTLLYPK